MKQIFSPFSMIFFLLMITASACKKDNCDDHHPPDTNACDTLLPIVFCHGSLASGDTWANQVMRFTSNGYCDNLLYAFDWNTLSQGGGTNNEALLNEFIDSVLARTGKTKVNLVGHSAGGGLAYGYCETPAQAAKVAHYVHIGSNSRTSPAGSNDEVPTMNISSAGDAVAGVTSVTGGINVELVAKDHYDVATCAEAFDEMFRFFNNGQAPATTGITAQSGEINISGRAVTLGENAPHSAGTVRIYALNAATGNRLNGTANFSLNTDAKGYWGPVALQPNTYYEFEIVSGISGDRVIHYYREPFTHNNPLVYLRTIPTSGLGNTLLGGLPENDNQSVLAVFTANQATVAGRDSMIVDGTVLSTSAIMPASKTVIATFLYDDNNNQQTDLSQPFIFGIVPTFLTARDMYFQTATPGSIPLRFNGRNMYVPNLRSASDGVIVAVFD